MEHTELQDTELREYFEKWKDFTNSIKKQKELHTILLISQQRRDGRVKSMAFQLLKQYQQYRENKRMRNLQVHHWQQRKILTKGVRGIIQYFTMLQKFQGQLQMVYCKSLMARHFGAMKAYRQKSPRRRDIMLELMRQRRQNNKMREVVQCWKMQILDINKSRHVFCNKLADFVKSSQNNQTRQAFEAIRRCQKKIPAIVSVSQTAQQTTQELFEFKRKYAPIRDVSFSKRTERTPSKRPTSPGLSRQSSLYVIQKKQNVRCSESKLRILRNLIVLKQSQIEYFGDPCFNDPLYEQYKSRLRLDLGHYLTILQECGRD